jgi:protein-disulfide isomerase
MLQYAARILFVCFLISGRLMAQATELTPAMRQRIEILLRSKVDFAPATSLAFTFNGLGELPGYRKVTAHFQSALAHTSGDLTFLLSADGATLAQLSTYQLGADPRASVPADGRPSRLGPPTAPVLVVVFDDLECPFCARLNQQLYPALASRYTKGQVRLVYQNVPIQAHPWSMRAAIDTDCLGKNSAEAYWAAVDTIHAHAGEYGGEDRKLSLAEQEIDAEALAEGRRFHIEQDQLQACIARQDVTPEQASLALGAKLGVTHTPTVFVNGAKSEGDVPMDFVFDLVDNALRAQGQTPPPREP